MRLVAHRLIAAVTLTLWVAPGLAALGLGLHLALDHHGHAGGDQPAGLADLLRAAEHGHHHEGGATADHEHDARVSEPASVGRPAAAPDATLPSLLAAPALFAERARPERPPRRGPPAPLYTAHCSLLL